MQADLVLFNGDLHTMDAAVPRARAVAISGNRVLATGSDDEIRGLLASGGRAMDLEGRTVVPGFTDSHLHFMSYGLSLMLIDLAEVPTLEEALGRVAAKA
ncbi:MAG: amidohydrolase family protein, partial [Anaerolineae bacterium]